jgi:hypothetical protein
MGSMVIAILEMMLSGGNEAVTVGALRTFWAPPARGLAAPAACSTKTPRDRAVPRDVGRGDADHEIGADTFVVLSSSGANRDRKVAIVGVEGSATSRWMV